MKGRNPNLGICALSKEVKGEATINRGNNGTRLYNRLYKLKKYYCTVLCN